MLPFQQAKQGLPIKKKLLCLLSSINTLKVNNAKRYYSYLSIINKTDDKHPLTLNPKIVDSSGTKRVIALKEDLKSV